MADAGPQRWRGRIGVAYESRDQLEEAKERLEKLMQEARRSYLARF